MRTNNGAEIKTRNEVACETMNNTKDIKAGIAEVIKVQVYLGMQNVANVDHAAQEILRKVEKFLIENWSFIQNHDCTDTNLKELGLRQALGLIGK